MKKYIVIISTLMTLLTINLYGQIDIKSYIPKELANTYLIALSQKKNISWQYGCDTDIINKAYRSPTYAVEDIVCGFNDDIPMDSINFNTDLSRYVIPIFYNYTFVKEEPDGNDKPLFTITTYFQFDNANIKINCYSDSEKSGNALKKEFIKRKWDYTDMYIYSIPFSDWGLIIEYKGTSYFWIDGKFVPAMEYIKKHYTLKEFREMFTAKLH